MIITFARCKISALKTAIFVLTCPYRHLYLHKCEQFFLTSSFRRTDGIGLSAPQVGINVQLMVFNPVGERGEGEEIVLVNPRVGKYSKKRVIFNEGCLSFPEIYADVEVCLCPFGFVIFLQNWPVVLP